MTLTRGTAQKALNTTHPHIASIKTKEIEGYTITSLLLGEEREVVCVFEVWTDKNALSSSARVEEAYEQMLSAMEALVSRNEEVVVCPILIKSIDSKEITKA